MKHKVSREPFQFCGHDRRPESYQIYSCTQHISRFVLQASQKIRLLKFRIYAAAGCPGIFGGCFVSTGHPLYVLALDFSGGLELWLFQDLQDAIFETLSQRLPAFYTAFSPLALTHQRRHCYDNSFLRVNKGLLVAVTLTPAMLEAAYELLRTTSPFRGWRLPPGEEVNFHVTRHHDRQADYNLVKGAHVIRMSQLKHQTLHYLVMSLAHELCHMKDWMDGARADVEHGAGFNRLADRVCKLHGFDRGQF